LIRQWHLLPVEEGSSFQILRREERIMFKKFLKDETGLELSEYAVAAALVALAAVVAFQTLGTQIGARINTLAGYIK
jgi:pilus assembly protein Flp/PilA